MSRRTNGRSAYRVALHPTAVAASIGPRARSMPRRLDVVATELHAALTRRVMFARANEARVLEVPLPRWDTWKSFMDEVCEVLLAPPSPPTRRGGVGRWRRHAAADLPGGGLPGDLHPRGLA
jgi:hypothetical protein